MTEAGNPAKKGRLGVLMSRVSRKESNAEIAEFPNSMELVHKLETGGRALKARDLAQLFGVTQQHIYKLAARGSNCRQI